MKGRIDGVGISFFYRGVWDLIYVWPWRRSSGGKWYSIDFEAQFGSLRELNDLIHDYLRDAFRDGEIASREYEKLRWRHRLLDWLVL